MRLRAVVLAVTILALGGAGALVGGRLQAQAATAGVEGFETCDFSQLPWETGGDATWYVTSGEAYSGSYAVRAGQIDNDESTFLELRDIVIAQAITFCYKVSSEEGFDKLRFYVDGALMGEWSGDTGWNLAGPFWTGAGTHTLTWEYSKDCCFQDGGDTVWIDDVSYASEATPAVVFVWDAGFANTDLRTSGHAQARQVKTPLRAGDGTVFYDTWTYAQINPDFFNTTGSDQYGLLVVLEGTYNIRAYFSDPWSDYVATHYDGFYTYIEWSFVSDIPPWWAVAWAPYSAHIGFEAYRRGEAAEVRVVSVTWLPGDGVALPVPGVRFAQSFEILNTLDVGRTVTIWDVRAAVVNEGVALENLNSEDLPGELERQGTNLETIHDDLDVGPGASSGSLFELDEVFGSPAEGTEATLRVKLETAGGFILHVLIDHEWYELWPWGQPVDVSNRLIERRCTTGDEVTMWYPAEVSPFTIVHDCGSGIRILSEESISLAPPDAPTMEGTMIRFTIDRDTTCVLWGERY